MNLTPYEARQARRLGETTELYKKLAALLLQWTNCWKSDNEVWRHRSAYSLRQIMLTAPSGSGIDCPVRLVGFDYSGDYPNAEYRGGALKFIVEFHHMDGNGYYDGWTQHVMTVKSHLIYGLSITFSGRDRNGLKDYLTDIFHAWLTSPVFKYDDVEDD